MTCSLFSQSQASTF